MLCQDSPLPLAHRPGTRKISSSHDPEAGGQRKKKHDCLLLYLDGLVNMVFPLKALFWFKKAQKLFFQCFKA